MDRRTIAALCVLALTSCGNEERSRPSAPRPRPAEVEAEPSTPPPPSEQAIAPVLAAYEELRSRLSAGDVADLFQKASAIEVAASRSAQEVPAQAGHLDAIATAAARLKETPAGDLAEARRSFGEVSRHVVALLRAERSFARGLRVYSCERATGFAQWAQRTGAEMGSPYTDDPCGVPVGPE